MKLHDYLRDPCGTLSIPYWKNKGLRLPPNMRIVHARDFDRTLLDDYEDETYFRLYHDLANISPVVPAGLSVRTAGENDLPAMADVINRSYSDLSATVPFLRSLRETPVFALELWIAVENDRGEMVACGMADLDREAGELILEWIQVLPAYRRKGVGRLLVEELLRRGKEYAQFATVSGKTENASKPELLYRACGFRGDDVWHILRRKEN